MAGRKSTREGGPDAPRDAARREQERAERARRRAERDATEAPSRARRTEATAELGRDWSDGEWAEPEPAPRVRSNAPADGYSPASGTFAAPATRAGRDRAQAFAPLAPASHAAGAAEEAAAAPGRPSPMRGSREKRERRAFAVPAPLAGAATAVAGAFATATALVGARRPAAAAAAAALVIVVALIFVATREGADEPAVKASKSASARRAAAARWAKSPYGVPTKVSLPPKTRIVAYTGAPRAEALGILGTVPFKEAAAKLKNQSTPYARPTRHVLRAYDLIATIASSSPGPAGKYRTRQPAAVIARYLRAARRDHATLVLDVQPGQSNFVDEIKPLERWLKEPDVQLALDPEWRMRPGVVPGNEIGYVSGGELQAALNRVASIVKAGHLPKKMVLVHRFTDGMIKDFGAVKVPKGILGVISIDGVGSKANKEATYDRIAPTLPKPWLPGFKLFYQEDAKAGGTMSGKDVMGLKPRPHVVLYE